MHESYFSRWRVGVCGTSHDLPDGMAEFCCAIGSALATHGSVMMVQGGLRRRMEEKRGGFAADWHFAQGFRSANPPVAWGDVDQRIETVLSNVDDDSGAFFVHGVVRRTPGRTREARRFAFVRTLNAMIAVGGGYGTQQQLTLAAALDLPILPVPFFGGSARKVWDENGADISRRLGLSPDRMEAWRERAASHANAVAEEMVEILLRCLPRTAFIITPFHEDQDTLYDLVIEPAVISFGDTLRRIDRELRAGDVNAQIIQGIRSCDYAIAVLDSFRPNVMYEMGIAQATGKPVIALLRNGKEAGVTEDVPFDIGTLQRINYDRPDGTLLANLRTMLKTVVRRNTLPAPSHTQSK